MRRLTLTLALFLLIPRLLYGQVAIDAVTDSGAQNASSGFTFAHTVAGSNRAMLVACPTSTVTVSSLTYNSVALSSAATATANDGVTHIEIWKLTAPATGTHNVVVAFSGSNDTECIAGSFTGVDQTTPFGTCVGDAYSASGTSHSHNTTNQVNGLVWDAFTLVLGGAPITVNGGQTTRTGPTDTAGQRSYVTSKPGAATVSTGYSWTNDFFRWAHATCPINPVAAAASSAGGLLLRGVGP